MLAIAALTAAFALVALPGIAGSRSPSSPSTFDPAAFQPIQIPASAGKHPISVGLLDPSFASAGLLDESTAFAEPGAAPQRKPSRPRLFQPAAHGDSAQKPPLYKLTGYATFYGNGTTAMRLPRGTTVIVCGPAGCIERIVNDYGPIAGTARVIDLYTPDFFDICGCPTWAGTVLVTVAVY